MYSKYPISLVVSDIEGCLSDGKGIQLDLATLNKIQNFNICSKCSNHPPLTLCSGRSQPFVEAFSQILAVTNPCICENGAILYDPISDQSVIHPAISEVHYQNIKELRRLLEKDIKREIPHKIEPGKEICISINPEGSPEQYENQVIILYEKLSLYVDHTYFEITHSASAVDITPRDINKGAGLKLLCDYNNIPQKNILGIGDTIGDLPFLRLVGMTAVPANAHRQLVDMADYVSTESAAAGVLDILTTLT